MDIGKKIITAIIKYQFGIDIEERIEKEEFKIEYSKKTGRIRRIWKGKDVLFTIEPTTGYIIPTIRGAEWLIKKSKKLFYYVIIRKDAVPFVSEGKNVFARFIKEADPRILPNDVVFIFDEDKNFIAVGISVVSAKELLEMKRGVVIKTKHAIRKNNKKV